MGIYDEVKDIHWWAEKYCTTDLLYVKYENNIVFSINKVVDTYQEICTARAYLYFMESENYGDLVRDNCFEKEYIKSMFSECSLLYYNIAVDLFWQILWLYYNKTINNGLPTNELYQECLKDCSYDELLLGITLCNDKKMVTILRKFFDKNVNYQIIRREYNYLKHRGTFNRGNVINQSQLGFNMDGMTIPKIIRKEWNSEELKRICINFDKDFISFCEYVLNLLFQEIDVKKSNIMEILNYSLKVKDKL